MEKFQRKSRENVLQYDLYITAMEEMNMEIERKWLVSGSPQGLPLREEFRMRQGYISVSSYRAHPGRSADRRRYAVYPLL